MKKPLYKGAILVLCMALIAFSFYLWRRSQNVYFEDKALHNALLESALNVNKDNYISKEEAKVFNGTLDLIDKGIRDLSGIEVLENLNGIQLKGNALTDISPLTEIVSLRSIYAENNRIEEVGKLEKLSLLRVLDLSGNGLHEIPENVLLCTNLVELYLSGNRLTSIEGIQSLVDLKVLHLSFNKIADPKPASELTELERLFILNNIEYDDETLLYFDYIDEFDAAVK